MQTDPMSPVDATHRRQTPGAFTLVELLVVIGVVSLLIGKGRLPIAAEDISNGRLDPQYVTDELYTGLGFPDFLESSGNPNGIPLSPMWQCPSATDTIAIASSTPVTNAGNGIAAKTVSKWGNVAETSYNYCGNGLGFFRLWATPTNQSSHRRPSRATRCRFASPIPRPCPCSWTKCRGTIN